MIDKPCQLVACGSLAVGISIIARQHARVCYAAGAFDSMKITLYEHEPGRGAQRIERMSRASHAQRGNCSVCIQMHGRDNNARRQSETFCHLCGQVPGDARNRAKLASENGIAHAAQLGVCLLNESGIPDPYAVEAFVDSCRH